jgi:MFS family permease
MPRVIFRRPLRSRNFRLIVASNVISLAGSAVYFVAIPFAVLEIGGSASEVGYVAVARLVPSIAFLPVGGAMADRLPRQRVMVAANILQALAQGRNRQASCGICGMGGTSSFPGAGCGRWWSSSPSS